jgi:two-component system, OmpR family, sensor histidine kinase QseC
MREKALHQIESGVDRAGHLLEQLLRLARLDPVQRLEKPVPVGLNAMIHQVVGMVEGAHPGAQRRFDLTLPAEEVTVRGDPELLRVALRNLVDNAVRYSRPADTVRIALTTRGDDVAVTVHDSGPGVPGEVLGKLGQRFYRGRDHSVEGSGLGLAIVTRIAELHGARLGLANHPDGGFVARIEGLRALPPGTD